MSSTSELKIVNPEVLTSGGAQVGKTESSLLTAKSPTKIGNGPANRMSPTSPKTPEKNAKTSLGNSAVVIEKQRSAAAPSSSLSRHDAAQIESAAIMNQSLEVSTVKSKNSKKATKDRAASKTKALPGQATNTSENSRNPKVPPALKSLARDISVGTMKKWREDSCPTVWEQHKNPFEVGKSKARVFENTRIPLN